jgi:hypothetical protein
MRFSRRLAILGLAAGAFFAVYAVGMRYSPALVRYVVAQALMEKSPAGTDPAWIESRLAEIGLRSGSQGAALERILAIAQRIQKLNEIDLRDLLAPESAGPEAPIK